MAKHDKQAENDGARENAGQWYRRSVEDVLGALNSQENGLAEDEAQSRLEQYGPNTIETKQEISAWRVLLHQFTSPLIYVLLAALGVTLAIQSWDNAIVIGLVLIVNGVIGFTQEYRAESAVQSLMEMVSPKSRVRRGGAQHEIESEDLVPGDVILLGEGEMVPADVRLIRAQALQVNESALTGESVPVSKKSDALSEAEEGLPPSDQANMAFMGTAVTSGKAEGVVVGTGAQTELGEIAAGVREAGDTKTPLQRRMDRLAKWIAAVILVIAAIAFAVGYFLMDRSLFEMLLLAISLSVAAIPAGLPIVMTVALAVGVRRMARRHAVIRHLPAVETLGSTTAIISDKTGTLTQNRMTVQEVFAGQTRYHITGEALSAQGEVQKDKETVEVEEDSPLYYALLAGLLNNEAELSREPAGKATDSGPENEQEDESAQEDQPAEEDRSAADEENRDSADDEETAAGAGGQSLQPSGDPMEVALLLSAMKAGLSREELQQRYPQTDEVPFRTERRFSATIHDVPDDQEGPLVLVKGAPEVIFEMSDRSLSEDGEETDLDRDALLEMNDQLASEGLRVLAMAIGRGEQAADSIRSDEPGGMIFVGMQGLMDPPRPEAVEAVDSCHRSGIRVMMVTGDHARTAAAIARQCHLDQPVGSNGADESEEEPQRQAAGGDSPEGRELPETRTGREVDDLSDEKLDELLRRVNVFARVKPNQKLRLVERLKSLNQIVAVTGDGVNDAPALKAAHLGAAMGQTGTDVAKEASDMVITDDNFASVYSAVEEGRTAFRNIRMATFFLLSTGGADVLIILVALGIGWPLPLLPAQILWCNVVTNGIADVALGFEPGEKSLYRRPPRPPSEGVLDRLLIERLVLVAIWLSAGTLGVFYWIYTVRGDSIDLARVTALTTLVLFQKVHVFNCRSEDVSVFKKSLLANKVLFIGVLISLAVHIAALYIPWTQDVLSFQPLPWDVWAVIIPVAFTAIIVNELHKYFRPRPARGAANAQQTEPWYQRLVSSGHTADQQVEELKQQVKTVEQTVEENRDLLKELTKKKSEND